MGSRNHRDLEVWKLSDRLRRRFIDLLSREQVRRDFEFCRQAGGAAGSACRNVAEGFRRFRHTEFAHFVSIAKGSLGELDDCADEALAKHYISPEEYRELRELVDHALAAMTALHAYLVKTPTPGPPHGRRRLRPRTR